jgi:cation diffusion facilitator family transporter
MVSGRKAMTQDASSRRKRHAAGLSIVSNTVLVIAKLAVGIVGGSIAAISEAVHSATDLAASVIAYASVRMSDQPADAEHPYGHGKVESLSCLAEALLIFLAAFYIIYHSGKELLSGTGPTELGPAILVMGLSVVVNFFMSRYLRRVARETDSQALLADAEHLHVDVLTAGGVFVGLALSQATGFAWLDPAAALCVALLILHAAVQLTLPALHTLLDARLPDAEEQVIRAALDGDPRVLGYHKLRTRKSGSQRHVDVHVQMADDCTFVAAHELSEELEDKIRECFGTQYVHVHIHMEPYLHEMQHQIDVHGTKVHELNMKRHAH